MSKPTPAAVAAHVKNGGLWRASFDGRRVPIFATLTVVRDRVCYVGSDPLSTAEFFEDMRGATWIPVDRNGDRL